ncbi:LOB domain-containing protein 40 [Castilleja foliolosa]|uniref:LOB domain-containing protein 40 n=1 Tax=Castilleja foliolosa TaxID=1961234 RepID=A0ABD3EJG3_9LAMI
MSCHGCRALRKGCPNECTLRAALQWIDSPESQANATLFLAKFYGRTGLINLLNAGPTHLRPEILRSLLYEACGRYIDPVHGSVGLLCSGNWPQCQTAMESVLKTGRVQVPAAGDNGSTVFLGHARAGPGSSAMMGPILWLRRIRLISLLSRDGMKKCSRSWS